MRAVMLEVPLDLLAGRRWRSADRWDEMWVGELHMVPPPADRHQEVSGRLDRILAIECLGVRAETVDGKLRLTWDGGSAEI